MAGKNFGELIVQSFGEENVDEFTIATSVNVEFGWVKYWRIIILPNSAQKFCTISNPCLYLGS